MIIINNEFNFFIILCTLLVLFKQSLFSKVGLCFTNRLKLESKSLR